MLQAVGIESGDNWFRNNGASLISNNGIALLVPTIRIEVCVGILHCIFRDFALDDIVFSAGRSINPIYSL